MLEQKLEKRIVLRLNSDDAYALKIIAHTLGLSISQVARMLIKSRDTLQSLERKINKLPL